MYKLICMSFDGEYKKEHYTFDTIQEAWDYSNDLGSKWFFYPFHFVVTESYKTIISTPFNLEFFIRKRVKTVSKIFNKLSKQDNMENADCDMFIDALWNRRYKNE